MGSNTPKSECVRYVQHCTLERALVDSISSRQVTTNRIPVTVFKSVLNTEEIEAIDIPLYLRENDVQVLKENLTAFSKGKEKKENVFEIVSDATKSDLSRTTLSEESNEYVKRKDGESDDDFSLRVIKTFFENAKDDKCCSYYGRDAVIPPQNITRLQVTSTIDPVFGVQLVEGVNTSMWYVGGAGSATSLHVEDGEFASMNILLNGKEKIWGFINHTQFPELKSKTKEYLGTKECRIFHKPGLLIDPELLKEWDIEMFFIVQKPGDLVYVSEAVMHFVINNGLNLAEARNFGTKSCTVTSEKTKCDCRIVGRKKRQYFVAPSLPEYKVTKSEQFKQCHIENCEKEFLYTENKRRHLHEAHGEYSYVCNNEQCNKAFKTKQSLHTHQKTVHEKKIKTFVCSVENCNKVILQKNKWRHLKVHESIKEKGTCDNCKKEMLKYSLPKHFKTCHGKLICTKCNKTFKTSQGHSQHRC